MKKITSILSIIFRRSEFLSPLYLVQWAILISAMFLITEAAGLRDFASVLNGTVGSMTLGWEGSIILAVIYVVAYLAFVVLMPILLLAALIQWGWRRILTSSAG